MKVAECRRCHLSWSLLPDGTLVEHPQPGCSALLCPGSRTRVARNEEPPASRPARQTASRRRAAARFTALLEDVDRLQQEALSEPL
jgi:hypothetical protein